MRRIVLLMAALAAALAAAGCFNPFSPEVLTQRVTTVAPSPTTPQNAVKLFEWCWVNRGVEEYSELFTDDYVFQSAVVDSAGNTSRDVLTRRNDEVETAQNMFIGTAERPPASKITLSFDRNLVPFPDTRPGHMFPWHQTIRTSVDLKVDIGDGSTLEVTGYALFYLTRGDSAAIPSDLKLKGFKSDSLRWWIDRWEDETLPSGGVSVRRARPGFNEPIVLQKSMAEVKAFYLGH